MTISPEGDKMKERLCFLHQLWWLSGGHTCALHALLGVFPLRAECVWCYCLSHRYWDPAVRTICLTLTQRRSLTPSVQQTEEKCGWDCLLCSGTQEVCVQILAEAFSEVGGCQRPPQDAQMLHPYSEHTRAIPSIIRSSSSSFRSMTSDLSKHQHHIGKDLRTLDQV